MKKVIIYLAVFFTLFTILILNDKSTAHDKNKVRAYAIIVETCDTPVAPGEIRYYSTFDVGVQGNCTFNTGQTSCTLYVEGSHTLNIIACCGGTTVARNNFTVVSDTSLTIALKSGSCPF